MAQLTTSERLVKLETLMTQVLRELKDIRVDIKSAGNTFVPIEKHTEDLLEIRQQIQAINSKRWVQNTLSAILGVVLTILVQGYLGR